MKATTVAALLGLDPSNPTQPLPHDLALEVVTRDHRDGVADLSDAMARSDYAAAHEALDTIADSTTIGLDALERLDRELDALRAEMDGAS